MSRTQENIDAACHHCGETSDIKAMASKGDEVRYFCHNSRKSCYNERRGTYFDDRNAGANPLSEAGADIISIMDGLVARMTAGLAKHEEGGQQAA